MTAELSNTNQLTTDEMTVDTDASHTIPRHLTAPDDPDEVPSLSTNTGCWTGQPVTPRPMLEGLEVPKAPAGTEVGDRESFGSDIVARLSPQLVGGPSEAAAQALTEQGWAVTIDEWAGVPPTFTPDLLWNRITLRTCDGTVVAVVFD